MPTFYFHVCDGAGFCEDQEGRDFPDFAAARAEAIRGLRDLMAGDLRAGRLNLAAFIEIEDEKRQLIETISIEEAVDVSSERGKGRGG